MRDIKLLEKHSQEIQQKKKQNELFKNLKTEVETGANGTQDYIVKKGINAGKKVSQCLK